MKNKSILMICPWLGLVNRGAETFSKELANNLAKEWNVTLVVGGVVSECNEKIEVINLSDFKKPRYVACSLYAYNLLSSLSRFAYIGFIFKCISICIDKIYYIHPEVLYQYAFMKHFKKVHGDKRKWDVIFPQNGINGILWANKQRKIHQTLVVYTGHGGIGRGEELILKSNPDLYCAISSVSSKWARNICMNVIHIPNGVNTNLFTPVEKVHSDKIRILSVGALTEFKRHELTIRAVQHIPNAFLTIVGAGEQHEMLLGLCENLLPGRYSIQSVSYNEMPAVYLNKDIFVLPSLNEPMGIVYLEALASGLKLVVPNDDVRREILTSYGFYTDVNDEETYAKDILKASVADQNDLQAYQYIVDRYSWENISKKYSDAISAKLQIKDIKL